MIPGRYHKVLALFLASLEFTYNALFVIIIYWLLGMRCVDVSYHHPKEEDDRRRRKGKVNALGVYHFSGRIPHNLQKYSIYCQSFMGSQVFNASLHLQSGT